MACPASSLAMGSGHFAHSARANWCGYRTKWQVVDARLYLTELDGNICLREPQEGAEPTAACEIAHFGPCDTQSVSHSDFVAAPRGGLFADWVSEDLRIALGEVIEYVHLGWGSRFEHEELLHIRSGLVTGRLEFERSEPERHISGQPETSWGRLVKGFRGSPTYY
jgi:hypothetical protein